MKKRSTEQERAEALLILRENDYDYKKTSKEVGIPVNTIRQWVQRYPQLLEAGGEVKLYQAKAEEKIIKKKISLIDKHFASIDNITGKALRHLEDLLPEATILETTQILKTVADIYKAFGDKTQEEKGENINIIAQVVNQQITRKD